MKTNKTILIAWSLFTAVALAPLASAQELNINPQVDIRAKVEAFQEAKNQLVQERQIFAETLRNMDADERRAAIKAFQEGNADRIAAHRALGEEIRAIVDDIRPERIRPERTVQDRPVPESTDVKDRIAEFRSQRDALLQGRRELLNQMKDASAEDRREALAALREENRAIIEQQRELARGLRDNIQDLREDRRNNH